MSEVFFLKETNHIEILLHQTNFHIFFINKSWINDLISEAEITVLFQFAMIIHVTVEVSWHTLKILLNLNISNHSYPLPLNLLGLNFSLVIEQ